jgi:hypothetical protein
MKTMRKMLMAFVAIATLGLTTACEKDNSEPASGNTDGNIVGTWKVDRLTLNGMAMNTDSLNIAILINEDGTGVVSRPDATLSFGWNQNGTTLTITPTAFGSSYDYTITLLTATEASITGTVVPGTDIQGDVTVHMVRIDNPGDDPDPNPGDDPDPNPGDTTATTFPAGTNWTYSYTTESFNVEYEGMTVPASIQLTMNLAFDAEGQNGTLEMNGTPFITLPYVGAMPLTDYAVSENASFTYTYDAATATGIANGHLPGTASEQVPFSYNQSANTIELMLPTDIWSSFANRIPDGVNFPISSLPTTIVFTRVN